MSTSPLTRATGARSRPRIVDAVDEVGQHGQLDAGLAERRQDLLDVAEEQPVGPDHQHALALEREAVRVEQVGGAVQGHDGLAGAGPALHDEHAGQRRPDDLVLLALDGGDDVAQPAGAGRLEGGDERAVALRARRPRPGRSACSPNSSSSMPSSWRPAGGEVAAAGQAHRLAAGGPVERLGDRRPPVDDHRLLVLVGHREAADVEGLAARRRARGRCGRTQRGVAQLQLGEPVGDRVPDDLALEAGLLGAAPADLDHALEPGRRRCAPPRGSRRRGRCRPARPRGRDGSPCGRAAVLEGGASPEFGESPA